MKSSSRIKSLKPAERSVGSSSKKRKNNDAFFEATEKNRQRVNKLIHDFVKSSSVGPDSKDIGPNTNEPVRIISEED